MKSKPKKHFREVSLGTLIKLVTNDLSKSNGNHALKKGLRKSLVFRYRFGKILLNKKYNCLSLLNFENWVNGEVSKIEHNFSSPLDFSK